MPTIRQRNSWRVLRAALWMLVLASQVWSADSTVRWQVSNPTVAENAGTLTSYLLVTPPPRAAVAVTWTTNAESAVAGVDFVSAGGTVTIPAGENRVPVSVAIINDAYKTGNRTFGLQITGITGANWGSPNYISATIQEDDLSAPSRTPPAVSWAPSTATVPSGSGATAFNLNLAYAWTAPVTVQWTTGQQTAVPGTDYTSASGTIVFAAGSTVMPATVDILAGARIGRTFGLQITGITGGAWGTPSYQTVTITKALSQVATPDISPASGAYQQAIVATASTATTGAVLHYRLDGAVPAATDPILAASGVSIDQPATLSVRGFADGWLASSTVTASYAFQVAPVTADLAAGSYTGLQTVTLSTATVGAEIRYTVDGSAPGAASALADGAITLPGSCTLRAVAQRQGWADSAPFSAAYVLQVAPVTADLAAGSYIGLKSVTLSTATAGAEIRYTVDGTTPTAASALADAAIVLPGSCTLRAVALLKGWSDSAVFSAAYKLRVATPVLTPTAGTYYKILTATASAGDDQAVIRFTTDGTNPTTDSPAWPAAGLEIAKTTSLRLRAYRSGWLDSAVRTGTYTLRVTAPTASPRGGTYVGGQQVTLSTTTAEAVIHYTLNGTAPTVDSPVATGPVAIDATATLRAIAVRADWRDSAEFKTTYTIRVAPVVADLASGTYVGQRSVGLSCATAGAEIRYTLDGTAPGASGILYTAPIVLPGSCTLKAVALLSGQRDSAVLTRTYILRVEPVTADLAAGTYVGEQQVTLGCATAGAVVRFTLDGTAPTATTGQIADGPITLQGNKMLRALATRASWSNSAAFRAVYRLRVPAPTPTPAAGTYAAWPLVMAQDADPAATNRYATGTSIPGSGSAVFPPAGIQLTKATTLNLIATRTGWTNSLVTTAAYARNLAPIAPAVSVSTDEDVAVAIAPTVTDSDSTGLVWSIVTQPSHGGLDGFSAATGAVSYIPAADWNGADAFQLAVSDGTSTIAVPVAVTVRAVDDQTVIQAPAVIMAGIRSDIAVAGLAVSDTDTAALTVTVNASSGVLSLTGLADSGAVLVEGTGLQDAGLALTGTAVQISTALQGLVWTAPDAEGEGRILIGSGSSQAEIATTANPLPAPVAVGSRVVTTWTAVAQISTLVPTPAAGWMVEVAQGGEYTVWLRAPTVSAVTILVDGVVKDRTLTSPAWSCSDPTGRVIRLSLAGGLQELSVQGAVSPMISGVMLVPVTAEGREHAVPLLAGPGAVAIVDAADYDIQQEAGGHSWLPTADGAIALLPDLGWQRNAPASVPHGLSYAVYFAQSGDYRLWIRGRGDGGGDSVWFGLDGGLPTTDVTGFASPKLMWSGVAGDGTPATIHVGTAGEHVLDLAWREDGVVIEQIAISAVSGWSPRQVRHPVSARRGIHAATKAAGVMIEAEATEQLIPGSYGGLWQDVPAAGAVGVAIQVPNVGWNMADTTALASSPGAVWYVRFPQAGTYDVWVRGAGSDYTNDSLHIGLAGDPGRSSNIWVKGVGATLPLTWSTARLDNTNAQIVVPAPGVYPVNLWMREDGAVLDRLIIQPAGLAAPTGSGPNATTPVSPTAGNG